MFAEIGEAALFNKERISIPGFGVFIARETKARKSVSKFGGEKITPARRSLRFKPSRNFVVDL